MEEEQADEAKAERMAEEIAQAGRKAELLPPTRSRFLVVRTIDQAMEALGVLVLSAIVLLLFVNAAGRYLFASPIGWAEEIATGLVVWMAMIGVFISVRRRDLIVVRVLVNKLAPKTQQRLHMIMTVVGLGSLSYLAWHGLDYVQTFGGDTTAYLALPKGIFFAAIPIGVALIMLSLLANIFRPPDPSESDAPITSVDADDDRGDTRGES